ncbi:MAG: hypothetical protein ACI915_001779 [Gammaproteobacteria bacterium]|jgi:hypothetical protein
MTNVIVNIVLIPIESGVSAPVTDACPSIVNINAVFQSGSLVLEGAISKATSRGKSCRRQRSRQ